MNPHDDPLTWGEHKWTGQSFGPGDIERRDDEVVGVLWLPDGSQRVVTEDRVIGFTRPA